MWADELGRRWRPRSTLKNKTRSISRSHESGVPCVQKIGSVLASPEIVEGKFRKLDLRR